MRSILLTGTVLPVALVLTSAVAATDPQVIGGAVRGPYASPPGWFGPGPAWGRWADPGPGDGWQYYGVPDGPFVNTPPARAWVPGYAPWYWGIPGATGSFWTNGLSLYGPPVPTYGPTPGVFSAGDSGKQFFRNPPPANGVWFGLAWTGYRSASPRHVPLTVSVHPPAESVQVVPGVVAATSDGAPCLRLAVRVPDAAADVWVEKVEMKQRGTERVFESPPLEAGKAYRYELIAKWTENGKERAESRTVIAKAGETVAVDFTVPDAVSAK